MYDRIFYPKARFEEGDFVLTAGNPHSKKHLRGFNPRIGSTVADGILKMGLTFSPRGASVEGRAYQKSDRNKQYKSMALIVTQGRFLF